MNNFPPNLDPKIYTLSATLIGFALIDNFNANEQNAIGNWFITIGQILENNSAWQAMTEGRISGNNININSRKFKETGDPYTDNKAWVNSQKDKDIEQLKKTVEIIQEQLKKMQ